MYTYIWYLKITANRMKKIWIKITLLHLKIYKIIGSSFIDVLNTIIIKTHINFFF